MELTVEKLLSKEKIKIYFLDILSAAAIYFLPALSHMLSFPLYLIEPMRVALVASIIFTNRTNAFIIAFTLPAFSYFISSHPVFIKAGLISTELLLNVFLFYYLKEKIKNTTFVFALSIIVSKIYYYAIKYFLLQFSLMDGVLISTPLLIQLIMILVFTGSFQFLAKDKE
ncbi:MAG: hypothetical protein F9K45_04665 [Melioribacteraceae bacterium]|nr:MAG: hypothetical protein F9K45_04665 [Melioribacteraceae bacterium]